MSPEPDTGLLETAAGVLPAQQVELLAALHRFTEERLGAADACREALLKRIREGGRPEPELHAFLRECWEALDGLAREVNVCMHHLFPEAGLPPPMEMTRQCTFYVIRKALHESPQATAHPVSRLLWERTREQGGEPYERLSFLYNLSLFLPLWLPEAQLPGTTDVPEFARFLLRPAAVDRCDADEGTREILRWLRGFAAETYGSLAAALDATPAEG